MRREPKPGFGWGLAVALALTGCGASEAEDEQAPGPRPPQELGPYGIGVTTLSVTSGGRELPIEVWYPAKRTGTPEQYVLKIGVLELARFDSPLGARRDASLDARGGPYPTVVFSHGNGGTRIQSVYLTEYLATHGFVVAAPDHVGNTFAEMINTANAISSAEAAKLRPQDVSRTLDALLDADGATSGVLRGSVDPGRVAVAGHSFGGFTALRVAGATIDANAVLSDCAQGGGLICNGWDEVDMPSSARDERFVAALAHAPGGAQAMFAGARNGFADVGVPVMIQGGTLDAITPFATEQQAPWDGLEGRAELLSIEDAGHFTFSDMCLLVEQLGLSAEQFQDGCGPDNIPWDEAHATINGYSTAFLQAELAGLPPSELLDESTPLGSGVQSFASK